MGYRTLLVHVRAGQSNAGLLAVAAGLAARLGTAVGGIVAARPADVLYTDGYVPAAAIQQDQADLDAAVKAAEAEFFAAFAGHVPRPGWRGLTGHLPLASAVAAEARAADLIVTSTQADETKPSRWAGAGDLVMQAGRPVLLVPPTVAALSLDRAVIGWKETREARRALADALPLLRICGHVDLLEIVPAAERPAAQERLGEVALWLGRHGIAPSVTVASSAGDDARLFGGIVREQAAGLVVAGAYGHSRLREWAFGGFTRDLLLRGSTCALVSH